MCKRLACIATFPGREQVIGQAVQSLLPQVDELHICINGDKEFSWSPPAGVHVSRVVDRGDASKFTLACQGATGYLFTCDDDIIYPHDYIAQLLHYLKATPKAAVGVHAARFRCSPPRNYRSDRDVRRCLGPAVQDVRKEHQLGTGTLAFHSSTIQLSWKHFENGFMADVWFALQAQYQQVSLLSIPHEEKWLKEARPQPADTIWARMTRDSDKPQIRALSRVKEWKLW